MAQPTDAELVARVRSGDREAYGTLISRYQGHVYGLAYSLVDDWAEAQDIAQDAFIRAYLNLDQLQDSARFAAWLRRVAFSISMNWLKSFRPELFRRLDGQVDLEVLEVPDFEPGPPESLERTELAEAVRRAVDSLPARYRLPLTMFHLDGLSYERVASFLDIPLGTAKSLIHRAREKLKLVLAPYVREEVAPMVQDVFNEHKLPPEFTADLRRLCLDWLAAGGPEGRKTPASKRKEQAERLALAAARSPEVALVNKWREETEPIPKWALAVNGEMPAWGIEICNQAWLPQLERTMWMIGRERALPDPAPGRCGSVRASRRQWATLADRALTRWLAGEGAAPDDAPPGPAIHSLLGKLDDDRAAAARLLHATLRLVLERSWEEFEQGFSEIEAGSTLARGLRDPTRYLQFMCGYRWESIFLDLCRAIGDAACRADELPEFKVGACNGQLSFAYRDDPLLVPTTCAILVGAWAWLQNLNADVVASAYPTLAHLAEHVRRQLGEVTPVKRWLTGRLFVGIRVWLGQVDHGDIEQQRPALNPYPTLVGP